MALPQGMTHALAQQPDTLASRQGLRASVSAVPKEFLDPPAAWNPTVALFLGGYGLAALTIAGWFLWGWPLPLLLASGFLALHLEGTVIHDACHNAAHPSRFWNAVMGHGAALLLGFSFPVFTRVHLQHHAHVNDPKNDPDHIVSTFGPLWLIAPRFFYHEFFFFRRKLWRGNELMEWGIARGIFLAIVLAGVKYGFIDFVFNCWFAPALMVGVTLGLFFDYLPHRPFQSRNRWHNARVYPGRMMNWLIMARTTTWCITCGHRFPGSNTGLLITPPKISLMRRDLRSGLACLKAAAISPISSTTSSWACAATSVAAASCARLLR